MNITSINYGGLLAAAPAITSELVAPTSKDGLFFLYDGDRLSMRRKITQLKDDLLALPDSITEFELKHTFAKGMYMREMFIPKGMTLVGEIHSQECINIVSKGDISIVSETGAARVKAGFTIVSPAGLQKVGYAHEDTIFINLFLTCETDIIKLEKDLILDQFNDTLTIEDGLT